MKKPSPYLTFAGTIPFIACAFLLIIDVVDGPILGSVADTLSAYGLVIGSIDSFFLDRSICIAYGGFVSA
ncbi:hypothetical protein ACQKCF_09865 [Psychrobacter proteolyticus]|uniref:hypothetical protein n=1 Tax=Psychrobacter proteolyticus TaxID=147825 RepID=UPI003D0454A9